MGDETRSIENNEMHGMRPIENIEVRGARVHNLRGVDVDIPLNSLVAIAGVSGSGKTSLAMGVLYAEGSRRYLEALSTYTRRRIGQATRADVEAVRHVPAAIALRQRPGVPDIRSTFGTSTEMLNIVRLIFSRLGSHVCPNGHRVGETLAVAAEEPLTCPTCHATFSAPGAEALAFNSAGACPRCNGVGTIRVVDDSTLIRDENLSIAEGTVLPWQSFGFNVQPQIAAEFGVRIDVPWRDLADWEKQIVLDGPEEKKHITVTSKKGVHELDFTFRNARLTVTEELKRATDDKRLARVAKFLVEQTCPDCGGTRLSAAASAPTVAGLTLPQVSAMTLADLTAWARTLPGAMPAPMREMADSLIATLEQMARRLLDLGLGYLSLDRASATLSTGERQRAQLARAIRNDTTGVLYVLDEPSIGLHPANVTGLHGVFADLLANGNSVIVVDHDPLVLRAADHLIEIGPGAGAAGGRIVASGTLDEVERDAHSRIGPYLSGAARVVVPGAVGPAEVFDEGDIRVHSLPIRTVHELDFRLPRARLSVVTGVSGSGKSTLVLDTVVPALQAPSREAWPAHVSAVDAGDIDRISVVDATPIGINQRSTVATYCGVLDELRKAYGSLPEARRAGLSAADFSYNTGSLRCPRCQGTGEISLDLQFLPDVDIPCPDCDGRRYAPDADLYRRPLPAGAPDVAAAKDGALSLTQLLAMTVTEALDYLTDLPRAHARLSALNDVGLGYVTLTEATPSLSGGEAQRLKLAKELGKSHATSLFVFDEPTVGLHPDDVAQLVGVLRQLVDAGATVLVIEHDLDLIANADYVIDMGPGGGAEGGHIVATGTPAQVAADPGSVTGRYLKAHLDAAAHAR
ncbi:MAG: excinuclease ABC subunit UvrA [Actinomycetaceae bacterium]|nr:excinuclease ABC subunit UvrA [Actinomycetaceae bacterium]MDU0970675.1 excinuclease ABC subunit UvrA [Actinomycetaceae bacterium]